MRLITLPVAHAVYIILYLPAWFRYLALLRKNRKEDFGGHIAEDFWQTFTDTIDTIVGCLDQ